MPYSLIPNKPGVKEVGEALHELLLAFKNDELTGLAFVANRRRGRYFTEVVGTCITNPTLARGAVGELTDKLAALQNSRHHEDTR
jgi:hypothetical protein